MNGITAEQREAAIELFTAKSTEFEKTAGRSGKPVTDKVLANCVRMADDEVFVEFGFRIKDLFVPKA